MKNTAIKSVAQEIIKEANQTHGNIDLLRVFLITNSADIQREYDFIAKLAGKSTDAAQKVIYNNALNTLINISLKRVEMTDVLYSAIHKSENVIIAAEPVINTEETKTIMMLPSLEDILVRVTTILGIVGAEEEARELLISTVGQGKVINKEGKPEKWEESQINDYIKANTPASDTPNPEVANKEVVEFTAVYDFLTGLIEKGMEPVAIKIAINGFMIGKVIKGSNNESDYFIKDEAIFNDYYNRILINIVAQGIIAFKKKSVVNTEGKETKKEVIAKEINIEVKPLLEKMEKDETQTSFAPVSRTIRDIHLKNGLKMTLVDAYLIAKELAKELAPSLFSRINKGEKKNVPIIPVEAQNVEIYDESHNIIESNKPLWAEVEKYELLNQLFLKGVELSKTGLWRDAMSMSIILISSGKIKETKDSAEPIKWDTDQIKLWYHSNVEIAANTPAPQETIDTKAEIIIDKKVDEISSKESTEKPSESSKSSQKSEEKIEEVKQGPALQVGTLESKEPLTRLLKDNTPWTGKYQFKSFVMKMAKHRDTSLSIQIVDATPEQEKDLLITEANLTKFLDEQRDLLVSNRNKQPDVKKLLLEKLSSYYEITASEIKSIVENLVKESDELRKELKKASKKENPTQGAGKTAEIVNTTIAEKEAVTQTENLTEKTTVVDEQKPKVLEQESVLPITGEKPAGTEVTALDVQSQKDGDAPLEKPAETEQSKTKENSPETTIVTDKSAGEETSNSNDDEKYEGFEEILSAKVKVDMHKAVYAKVLEYKTSEEGIKAVFDVINSARKNTHYKKAFIRNYKAAQPVDLLAAINNIVTAGAEIAKNK